MKIDEIVKVLNAKVLACDDLLDSEIYSACGSDLMSDVMAFVKDEAMLLTGLVNLQVIRTAEMMDIKAVIFVRGKKPEESMIQLAEQKKIVLLTTDYPMYASCGKLYSMGIKGNEV